MTLSDESVKRIMTVIAEEMGIEFGQEFGLDSWDSSRFTLREDGVYLKDERVYAVYAEMLHGQYFPYGKISPKWQPRKGDTVYVILPTLEEGFVLWICGDEKYTDMLLDRGLMFRTEEEAIAEAIERGWRNE